MAEDTSTALVVNSALCSGTNLVQAGMPVEVRVSVPGTGKGEEEREEGESVTAVASGKQLGEAEVDIREESCGTYVIRLVPGTPDEYTLEITHLGEQIEGSPFVILAADRGSSGDEVTELTTITAGKPVAFLIPVDGAKQPFAVSVKGPSGVCESSINEQHEGQVTVNFTPSVPGGYTIKVELNSSDIEGSPFQLTAKGLEPDASKCFVLEENLPIFKKPVRFGVPARFKVSTANAGHGILTVISQGPGRADVKTFKNGDGTESCEFVPSIPGKYHLDVLWAGEHIPGSPYRLTFRRPKTRIVSDGLNLQNETYHIDVPHRFRLNCQALEEGGLEIACEPERAAEISITPLGDQKAFVCEILPKVVGDHRVRVTYKGKNIGGSPFDVHFSPNASKCKMTDVSSEHEIGSPVQFVISTDEAGTGAQLTATVCNKASQSTIPVTVTQLSNDQFQVEFNPGEVMECQLEIRYDNEHIRGSPFSLMFSDPRCCRAKGQGLQSAECGTRSKFTVVTENAGPGVLWAMIEAEDGTKTKPMISTIDTTTYEVGYRLTQQGGHRIHVKWGKFDIPGSPFLVYCYEMTHFGVKDMPAELHLGKPLEFTVEGSTEMASMQAGQGKPVGELTVRAKSTRGAEVQGVVEQLPSGNFACRLQPTVPGKYNVSVCWNGANVPGSPFRVRVTTPPIPENVRAHGPGLEDGLVGQEGNFTVETAEAGTGLLAVRVHGPKGAFKINTTRDRNHPRSILVSYSPTHVGTYVIEITWAGVDIPGSPYRVAISEEKAGGETEEEKESKRDGEAEEAAKEEPQAVASSPGVDKESQEGGEGEEAAKEEPQAVDSPPGLEKDTEEVKDTVDEKNQPEDGESLT